jgi:stearoyl-CoA desaturase (delta-9 desaturase)
MPGWPCPVGHANYAIFTLPSLEAHLTFTRHRACCAQEVDHNASHPGDKIRDPSYATALDAKEAARLDITRTVAFVAMHLGLLLIPVVGVSWTAIALATGLYVARMFLITGVYHRYFAHRSYETSRATRFVLALLGCTAGQRGPIWWAAHHREHHLESDNALDPHSPTQKGRFYSHCLWFLTRGSFRTPVRRVQDWVRYRELRWLERLDWLPFIGLGAGCAALGHWLSVAQPQLQTSAAQLFIWGFVVSTVVLYHATYTINSLAHGWGSKRFDTGDDSRNNPLLALLTLGEGWHNNHHYYPVSARQGFYWWELDLTHVALRLMARVGLVSRLRPVPARVLAAGRNSDQAGPSARTGTNTVSAVNR